MVSQIIFLLIMVAAVASLVILIGSRFWWSLQLIYINSFAKWTGDDDYLKYDDVERYMKSGNTIPVLYLSEYNHMRVYQPDEFESFIKSHLYYILIFPNRDIALYHNDELAICSFYDELLLHLMRENGYSKDIVSETIQRGQKLCKQWDEEYQERQSQLRQQIKEVEENMNHYPSNPSSKENNFEVNE